MQAYAHETGSVHLFGNVAEKECGKSLEIVESRPRPVLTHKATLPKVKNLIFLPKG